MKLEAPDVAKSSRVSRVMTTLIYRSTVGIKKSVSLSDSVMVINVSVDLSSERPYSIEVHQVYLPRSFLVVIRRSAYSLKGQTPSEKV